MTNADWTEQAHGIAALVESSVTYSCVKEGDPGEPVVCMANLPAPTGGEVRRG